MLAPICLFTYNRLKETRQTLEALKMNLLASISDLFIFSDGPKDVASKLKVEAIRKYLYSETGFKSITIFESEENKGLANSIISGVSNILHKYGKIIVLEDDLITTPNFLDYMNSALYFYENNLKIHSISGYSLDLPSLKNYSKDYYLGYRASSWGWATWLNRWQDIDWEVRSYNKFKYNYLEQYKFMKGGSDLPRMLKAQMKGYIDSWAIRWCYDQFKQNRLTVFPSTSKITNIGFGKDATHTKRKTSFQTILDKGEQTSFSFDDTIILDKRLIKEFRQKFSISSRLMNKIHFS